MPGTFTYDGSKVVVTNGIEGTPATFADIYAADLDGTFEILAATGSATGMTLDTPIQPANSLALHLDFILSGTSAGATDTIDITGTDFSGAAQSESIDVSGGDGTYNGILKWATISNIDCTGWADGTLEVVQNRWGVVSASHGPELVINGDFATDSDWVKHANVTIAGGVATSTGSIPSFSTIVRQEDILVNGTVYKATYDVTVTGGTSIRFGLGFNANDSVRTTSGTYSFIAAANQNGNEGVVLRTVSSDFIGTIDNVSVREVLPQYTVAADIDFGDGATSTYFTSTNEMVYFEDGKVPIIKDNATFEMGDASGDWSIKGSAMSLKLLDHHNMIEDGSTNAVFKTYGSLIMRRDEDLKVQQFHSGTWIARNLIYTGVGSTTGSRLSPRPGLTLDWKNVNISYLRDFTNYVTPAIFEDVHIHDSPFCYVVFATHTVPRLRITDTSWKELDIYGAVTLTLKDPKFHPDVAKMQINDSSGVVIEQYTTNIHVTDKDGANLPDVDIDVTYAHLVEGSDSKTYKCIQDHTAVDATHEPITGNDWASFWVLYDADGGLGGDWDTGFDYKADVVEFSTVTTDANGDITEQVIQYKKWVGTDEVLEARIHKFTFTHPDYPTYTMNNITVSSPINWRIEMGISTTDLQSAVWGYIPDPSVTVPNSTEDLLVENNNVLDNQAGPSSTMTDAIVDNTGFAPTTTQFESSEITDALPNHYEGRVIIFRSGDLKKAASDITAYSLEGGRGRFTVSGFPQAPANGDEFSIV